MRNCCVVLKDEEKRVFEAEPSIGASITAALQMAVKKGRFTDCWHLVSLSWIPRVVL